MKIQANLIEIEFENLRVVFVCCGSSDHTILCCSISCLGTCNLLVEHVAVASIAAIVVVATVHLHLILRIIRSQCRSCRYREPGECHPQKGREFKNEKVYLCVF